MRVGHGALAFGAALFLPVFPSGADGGGGPDPEPLLETRLFMPGHIMIPGQAGGADGYFALDTGAPANAPTLPAFRNKLQGARDGAGGKRVVEAGILIAGKPFSMEFGTGDRLAPVVEKVYPGVPVLAVLGAPFLSRYTVRVDFLAQTFSLYAPGALPLPGEKDLGPEHLLADFTTTSLGHILVDIAMGEKDALAGKALLDLGTPRFEFPSALGRKHGFPEGKIPTMRIGGMVWKDVPFDSRREKLLGQPLLKDAGVLSLLSVEQVRGSVVTIFYGEKKLAIRRDPARAPGLKPEAFGLELGPDGTVTRVREKSRAAACGLAAGDVVRAVDGRAVANRMEAESAFRFHDGKTPLSLDVARAGAVITIREEAVPE